MKTAEKTILDIQKEFSGKLSEEWMSMIAEGIQILFENYDLLTPISFSPMNYSTDDRILLSLSHFERLYIRLLMHSHLGFEPLTHRRISSYVFEVPGSKESFWGSQEVAQVFVYPTKRINEQMYLHEILFPDLQIAYAVAPKDFTFDGKIRK